MAGIRKRARKGRNYGASPVKKRRGVSEEGQFKGQDCCSSFSSGEGEIILLDTTDAIVSSSTWLTSNYVIQEKLGEGTFGCVYKATEISSNKTLAIKALKGAFSHPACLSMPEVEILPSLRHPNIIHLHEFIQEGDTVFLVFEFMEASLHKAITSRPCPLPESHIRRFTLHIARGLHHMHQAGYIHRDLKPENVLVRGDTAKLADFGLSCPISDSPFTDHVGTLWYQAPEVLLGSQTYGPAVDMWALGVMMVEMYFGGRRLFPGSSLENQLSLILYVLGDFDEDTWAEGVLLARAAGCQFPKDYLGVPISYILAETHASVEAIDLIEDLLSWSPSSRPTAAGVLAHRFIASSPIRHTSTIHGCSFDCPIEIA